MRLIFATCSSDEAETLARTLLEERLVGCANLIPGVTSLYWWENELTLDEEVVMFMETTDERVDEATERLRSLHPYDVPKIVVIDPESADPDYMTWLHDATQPEDEDARERRREASWNDDGEDDDDPEMAELGEGGDGAWPELDDDDF